MAWVERADGIELHLRVTPRAGRDAVEGVGTLADGRQILKVRVRAVPDQGAANEAVRRLLATLLGCPASSVRLETGAAARLKTVRIAGDPVRLASALAAVAGLSG